MGDAFTADFLPEDLGDDGLASEGAPLTSAIGEEPDPEMIPGPDRRSVHADRVATGETTEPLPAETAEVVEDTVELDEEALEEERPIAVPPDDPLAEIDLESDDPLAGSGL